MTLELETAADGIVVVGLGLHLASYHSLEGEHVVPGLVQAYFAHLAYSEHEPVPEQQVVFAAFLLREPPAAVLLVAVDFPKTSATLQLRPASSSSLSEAEPPVLWPLQQACPSEPSPRVDS